MGATMIKWIKCKDTLPEVDGRYLTWQPNALSDGYITTNCICQGHWNCCIDEDGSLWNECEETDIVAWAKVEPYEQRTEGTTVNWIACKDELPANDGRYLTWTRRIGADVLYCCRGHWNCHLNPDGALVNKNEINNVIAWAEIVPFEDKE